MELKKYTRLCCICNSDKQEELLIQNEGSVIGIEEYDYQHRIVICEDCGFVYASPILSEDLINKHYRELSNYENPQYEGDNSPEDKNKFNRTYQLIKSVFPEDYKGKILDIGSGVAYCLSLFLNDGWNVLGIDPSKQCAEYSKRIYNVPVRTGFFSKKLVADYDRFDVVVLSHVVEHLIDPNVILKDIYDILSPNGVIYIEVPNLLKPYVPVGYFMFEHLNYFTPDTLSSLLGKQKFKIERLHTFDNSVDVHPFYPVISSISRKSDAVLSWKRDYKQAKNAVINYKKTTSQEADKIKNKVWDIVHKHSGERISLWGGGIHTSQLLSFTGLTSKEISLIIDNDNKKHGKRILNIDISLPNNISSLTDVIIISSRAFEQEIYDQISYLKEKNISVYKIYNDN